MNKFALLVLVLLCSSIGSISQTIEKSVSKVISSKAAKGDLYKFEDIGDQLKLTYLIKESKKGNDLEEYLFDKKTLEFQSVEQTSEYVQENSGKEVGNKILRVYPNLVGKPKIKLGTMRYTYYPRFVDEDFIVSEEVTPTGDAGEKIIYVHHRTAVADDNMVRMHYKNHKTNVGDVQLLGQIKQEPLFTAYRSMVFEAKDLSAKAIKDYNFEYSYQSVCAENLPNGNIAAVLRVFTMNDFPKSNASKKVQAKYSLAPEYHLKYIELNTIGEMVQEVNIPMVQPESGYTMQLDIVASTTSDDVVVVGTCAPLKLLANALARMGGPRQVYENEKPVYAPKASQLFIANIGGNKMISMHQLSSDDFLKNAVSANGEKLPKDIVSYFGKWGQTGPVPIDFIKVNGDLNLLFKFGSSGVQMMQINEDSGNVKNTILTYEKGKMININPEFFSNSKGEIFLISYEQPSVKNDAEASKRLAAAAKREGKIYKVSTDVWSGGISLTPEASLDLYDPFIIEDEDHILTIGNGRKKEIVLSRVSLN